ncbi:unnamed protein product [Notodromas monacha]|uniref:Uncharacterized protein n=1 Tax=Notodromas monacha TaxID=399045 RepID=A0A7R9BLF4_9CRUS|nr:unnamed protein product [Notodromas monacha]CAG0916810.1 unnamed protein product [Notodromas monacha]
MLDIYLPRPLSVFGPVAADDPTGREILSTANCNGTREKQENKDEVWISTGPHSHQPLLQILIIRPRSQFLPRIFLSLIMPVIIPGSLRGTLPSLKNVSPAPGNFLAAGCLSLLLVSTKQLISTQIIVQIASRDTHDGLTITTTHGDDDDEDDGKFLTTTRPDAHFAQTSSFRDIIPLALDFSDFLECGLELLVCLLCFVLWLMGLNQDYDLGLSRGSSSSKPRSPTDYLYRSSGARSSSSHNYMPPPSSSSSSLNGLKPRGVALPPPPPWTAPRSADMPGTAKAATLPGVLLVSPFVLPLSAGGEGKMPGPPAAPSLNAGATASGGVSSGGGGATRLLPAARLLVPRVPFTVVPIMFRGPELSRRHTTSSRLWVRHGKQNIIRVQPPSSTSSPSSDHHHPRVFYRSKAK